MTIRYNVHGVRFSIDADGPLAATIADAVMPASVRAGRSAPGETAFAVRREGRRLRVDRGRRRLWDVSSEGELIPWLESEIVAWLLKKLRRYVPLHAAVAARRGRAVLLPGGPDAGKTSMACALALAGWAVMSDEVALVEPRALTVASFPRRMFVDAGTARRLPPLRGITPRRVTLERGRVSVRYVHPEFAGARIPDRAGIAALAFPEWSRRSSVSPMGEREALERLLGTLFNADRRPRPAVETCVKLVRNTPRFRLHIGKLGEAAFRLSEAVEAEQ